MADMALEDLRRCAQEGAVCVIEHPARSWLFHFKQPKARLKLKVIYFTQLYQQDYGGDRCKRG